MTSVCNVLFSFAVESIQIWKTIKTMSSIHSVIPSLLIFAINPMVITIQIGFLLQRKKLLQFFSDFKTQVEIHGRQNQIATDSHESIKIKTYIIYTGYSCLGFGLLVYYSIFLFDIMQFEHYVSHSSVVAHFRDLTSLGISPKFFLASRTLHTLSIIASILISDMVPALVYNHAAIHIKSLQAELDSIFRSRLIKSSERTSIDIKDQQELCGIQSMVNVSITLPAGHSKSKKNIANSVKTLLTYYDSIRSIVIRADSTFGPYLLTYKPLPTFCYYLYSGLYAVLQFKG